MKLFLLPLVLILTQAPAAETPSLPIATKIQVLTLQRDINGLQADILYMESQRQKLTEQLQQQLKQLEKEGFVLNTQTLNYEPIK